VLIRFKECSACSSADNTQQLVRPLSRSTTHQNTSELQPIRRQPRQKKPKVERIVGVGLRIHHPLVAAEGLPHGYPSTVGLGRPFAISATIPRVRPKESSAVRGLRAIARS
jgi:hypothetical protein